MSYKRWRNGKKQYQYKLCQKQYTQSNQSPWTISDQSKIYHADSNINGINWKSINSVNAISICQNETPNVEA